MGPHRWLQIVAVAVVAVTPAVHAAGPASLGTAGSRTGRPAGVVLPVDGLVSRPFDAPAHPYGPGHRGVDLTAAPGAPVRSAAAGVVTFSGQVAGTGWVTVAHGAGLDTTYGPLAPRVAAGQRVRVGQRLGRLAPGASWLDWGARLDGRYVDPLGLLGRWRVHLAPAARAVSRVGGTAAILDPSGRHRAMPASSRAATRPAGRAPCRPGAVGGRAHITQRAPRGPRSRVRPGGRGEDPLPAGPDRAREDATAARGVRATHGRGNSTWPWSACASCWRRESTSDTRPAAGTRR